MKTPCLMYPDSQQKFASCSSSSPTYLIFCPLKQADDTVIDLKVYVGWRPQALKAEPCNEKNVKTPRYQYPSFPVYKKRSPRSCIHRACPFGKSPATCSSGKKIVQLGIGPPGRIQMTYAHVPGLLKKIQTPSQSAYNALSTHWNIMEYLRRQIMNCIITSIKQPKKEHHLKVVIESRRLRFFPKKFDKIS